MYKRQIEARAADESTGPASEVIQELYSEELEARETSYFMVILPDRIQRLETVFCDKLEARDIDECWKLLSKIRDAIEKIPYLELIRR